MTLPLLSALLPGAAACFGSMALPDFARKQTSCRSLPRIRSKRPQTLFVPGRVFFLEGSSPCFTGMFVLLIRHCSLSVSGGMCVLYVLFFFCQMGKRNRGSPQTVRQAGDAPRSCRRLCGPLLPVLPNYLRLTERIRFPVPFVFPSPGVVLWLAAGESQ